MCTFLKKLILISILLSFTNVNAESYFGGFGGDYLDPRIERNNSGNSSFSTASELSYQYYGTFGVHFDRKKRHSLRGTYTQRHLELEAPSNRTFTELEFDLSSYNIMYSYAGKSFDIYLDYLQDSPLVFDNQILITQFTPTLVKTTFAGLGLRFKAYSDKPHNLFSYNRNRRYQDDRGSKVKYSKGFRLVLDFAYYYQISSEEHLNAEIEYKSKIKAGIKIEKGGTFNYGAKINFLTEKYDWSNDSYSVLDFGGGVFLKINY